MNKVAVISAGLPALSTGLATQGWQTAELEPDTESDAGSPYALVATADGTAVAVRRAVQSPRRVSALVMVAPPELPLPADLVRIQCPTLVVFGNDDPQADTARAYRAQIPNCHIAFVYDAGPDIAVQRPQSLLNLAADFLERRETFIVSNRCRVINP